MSITRKPRCLHPFTSDVFSRRLCDDCGADRTPRRNTIDGCNGCTPGMRPMHDPSNRCVAGNANHCSCSGCFG